MHRLWKQLAIATNWPVLAAVAVLCALGVMSIWAAGQQEGTRQAAFMAVGIGCMAAFQAVDYRRIGRWGWPFYLGSLFLLLYTVAGAALGGPEKRNPLPLLYYTNGTFAWLHLGPFGFQPSELTKIAFILVLARYLRFRSNYRSFKGLLPPFALAAVPMALILKQPDLGTALTFIPALLVMLFVAGAKIRHLAAVVGLGLVLALVAWFSGSAEKTGLGYDLPLLRHMPAMIKGYQRYRVMAMFSSEPGLERWRYQQRQALIAMGSGGVGGKGAGNLEIGRGVPEAQNDMIFALIAEQFGFFGSLAVLGAYVVLFAAGVEIAAATKEPFGRLIAVGVVALLAGQTFLNLMVVTRMMPVTGVTLPFVSSGGSSLIASFIAAGLLLNVGQNRPVVMAREAFEFD